MGHKTLPQVKAGDRIRVTYEDTVQVTKRHLSSPLSVLVGHLGDREIRIAPGSSERTVVSVEVLPPPERDWQRGDVIEDAVGSKFTREDSRFPWRLIGAHEGADPWFEHDGPIRPLTLLIGGGTR